jgi:prepilin-type N-terminal cleavage/methylation domain-containing protein
LLAASFEWVLSRIEAIVNEPTLYFTAHRANPRAGFTLVEVLVAIVVVAIGVTGLATLTNITSSSQVALKSANSRGDAVAADIAEIQRINDRFTCASGTCLISSSDVSQNGYFPSSQNAQTTFRDRCAYRSNLDLVTTLAGLIPANSSASAALTASGVTRAVTVADQGQAHRYTVTYTAGGSTLATLTLVPTTAAWCP